ncbi:hypothetical protein HUU62_20345 [Rhodoferax sp. 4810]|nr:hypothetical protein [Rhodoferax jenense]
MVASLLIVNSPERCWPAGVDDLALLGYGLGALTKPVFALASGTGLVVVARLVGLAWGAGRLKAV